MWVYNNLLWSVMYYQSIHNKLYFVSCNEIWFTMKLKIKHLSKVL